jgi:hypothetical protein
MTNYSELINQLRASELWTRHERDGFRPDGTPFEAADALEAQAKRIATLEELRNEYRRAITLLRDDTRARIAELEKENVTLREALNPVIEELIAAETEYDELDNDELVYIFKLTYGDLRAARAALNGEK